MNPSAVIVGEGVHWPGSERVIRWEEYDSTGDEVSLPKCVEEDADLLRKEYLAWVHELNSAPIEGRTLPDRLTVCEGISAWWSGTFVEKSLYKSPQIYDVLRLRALERHAEKAGIKQLVLTIPDGELNEALKNWCQQSGIAYRWERRNSRRKNSLRSRIRRWLPASLQAALFLVRYLWRSRVFLFGKTPAKEHGLAADGLTFFSYFEYLDRKLAESGRFGSLFWGELPAWLGQQRKPANWVFHYIPSALCPSPRDALELAGTFNLRGDSGSRFFFIEQWLSWRVVGRAALVYRKIRAGSPREASVRHSFRFRGSRLDFWPLMRQAWRKGMRGSGAVENALTLSLFSELASRSPQQARGISLAEYQGWERALLQCWRKYGHKAIFGYVHATIRFFDLRYYEDEAAYRSRLPRYDGLLASGQFGLDMLRAIGYPPGELVKVEALRYLYLTKANLRQRAAPGQGRTRKRILVLTDSDRNGSIDQIRMLGRAVELSTSNNLPFIVVKPHANLGVGEIVPAYLPAGSYEITDAPLSELLNDVDLAYTSNFTSASLDTCYSKVPTIVAMCGAQINMSPLRGVPGVAFATNPSELMRAMENPRVPNLPGDYFYLNDDLGLWREWLAH